MIDATRLLADLQGDLKDLVAGLRERVDAEEDVRARLEREYQAAFDGGRTGRTFVEWSEERLTQVAVAWLLAGVFVRFGEDNGLIDDARIAGPGARGVEARAAQQDFFVAHPNLSDRDYLQDAFRRAAALPGLAGVLGEGESPLWLVDPPADACTRLLERFRAVDDAGDLIHDFTDPEWSTRFLGDLYQELSEYAKEAYALLQTPDFVEEFILDRTLDPAVETFGLAATRLIDPTCGSGHFLLGAFDLLWRAWHTAEPATPERVLAQRALDSVWGVDLNPFAAAIARFRLLVAALRACGIPRLVDAPDFDVHVTVGDSLLWGAREGQLPGMERAHQALEHQYLYATEHADDLIRTFGQTYTAVVGNPPYITVKDPALNTAYRQLYGSCLGTYSLGVPFTERFFELATPADANTGRPGGFVGMITTNSFMKRAFGKRLIEDYLPMWDLTHVIDTSGAYIPGHGTPTVILFGRNQRPVTARVRSVLGIRGEPSTPADPANGLVWKCIVDQIDESGSESTFVTVTDTERSRLAKHPWSLGGGGAAELHDQLGKGRRALSTKIDPPIGRAVRIGSDEAYELTPSVARRQRVPDGSRRGYLVGEAVRDWSARPDRLVWYPYAVDFERDRFTQARWPWRSLLEQRRTFQGVMADAGLDWWDYMQYTASAYATTLSIAFSNVSTHNHFGLNRGRSVFNAHAPVIKLPEGATVEDHIDLLGLLNSSVACFWMQQVFHNKGGPGGGSSKDEKWRDFYEFDGTKLKQFPLPTGGPPRPLAFELDRSAGQLAAVQPAAVCASGVPSRAALDVARAEAEVLFARMVGFQEELDWHCLHVYGLTDEPLTVGDGEEPPALALGERAFEIVLARQVAAGQAKTRWFADFGGQPITEVPSHWPEWYQALVNRRIELIESDRNVGLVERPQSKRRWERGSWEQLESAALREWLLERLEDRDLWFEGGRAVCRTVRQLADRVTADADWMSVARLWVGDTDIDPVATVESLVADQHVPAQAAARYKPSGLVKRAQWEAVWELQRAEDRGEDVGKIPVPPKYGSGDFAKTSFWSQRGKLDVPKERFTSVPGAERDGSTVLAWAGFDDAELAQALATMLHERQTVDGWSGEQLVPILVALAEVVPWVAQWHPDPDPGLGQPLADFYRGMIDQTLAGAGLTATTLADWRPPAPTRGRRSKKTTST